MSKEFDAVSIPLTTAPARVLIALSDAREARDFADCLEAEGLRAVLDPAAAELTAADLGDLDVVVADADGAGAGLALALGSVPGAPALILLSTFGTVRDAVEALRQGAADFFGRPVSPEQLALSVRRAIDQRRLEAENQRLRRSVSERFALGSFTTRDARTRAVLEVVESVADTRATVLIEGESGTGKSLLARVLHERSARAKAPFVVVHCGALPPQLLESELFGHMRGSFTGAVRDKPGRFEEAAGGTLFLDEISTAPLDLQVKLLRAVQERTIERVGSNDSLHVDARFVFASNRDLKDEVAAGRFREDLYYRIHVVALRLPPLRERPSDVPLLAQGFLERYRAEYRRAGLAFSEEALASLCASSWPGNVRQLENTIERAVLLARGERIEPADLGGELAQREPNSPVGEEAAIYSPPSSLREALEAPEKRILVAALELNGWSRQRTAAMLDINRATLFNKMRKHGLLDRAGDGPRALREAS
jgi:DNA-binding NtrC family response regulator